MWVQWLNVVAARHRNCSSAAQREGSISDPDFWQGHHLDVTLPPTLGRNVLLLTPLTATPWCREIPFLVCRWFHTFVLEPCVAARAQLTFRFF